MVSLSLLDPGVNLQQNSYHTSKHIINISVHDELGYTKYNSPQSKMIESQYLGFRCILANISLNV